MKVMRYRGVRGIGADDASPEVVYTILGIPWYWSVGAVGALVVYLWLFRGRKQ